MHASDLHASSCECPSQPAAAILLGLYCMSVLAVLCTLPAQASPMFTHPNVCVNAQAQFKSQSSCSHTLPGMTLTCLEASCIDDDNDRAMKDSSARAG